MTKKIFWQDPYLTELTTTVTSVVGPEITLQETIFYALSGGQESDSGTIGGYPVLNACKQGLEIYYTLEDHHTLKVGDTVKICIDGQRRYRLMRLHFAAEIVLELIYQSFPNLVKIGAHIAETKARIDFESAQSLAPIIAQLEEAAQRIIDTDQTVISAFSDEAKERRYWKINEFAQVPCGGTHIKHLAEIGKIKLKRVNPGKGKERIEIFVS